MNYNFEKYDWDGLAMYGVNSEKEVLENLDGYYWTSTKIQELIDGIKSTKDSDEEYKYQNEGDSLLVYSNGFGVQFFDLQHQRKEADLILPHDIFIQFLEDFKKFVAENS